MRTVLSFIALLFLSQTVSAGWWSDEWTYRVPISVSTPAQIGSPNASLEDVNILVRLHAGNFQDFFLLKEDLSDLRFIAGDDQTPLKFHVDAFDLINQLMFIWVKVPNITPGTPEQIWMYYGNASAVPAEESTGTFDVNQLAVFHIRGDSEPLKDSTAYKNSSTFEQGGVEKASIIAAGLAFSESTKLSINDSPVLRFDSTAGVSLSAWFKPSADGGGNATLFHRSDEAGNSLTIATETGRLSVRLITDGQDISLSAFQSLETDSWQQLTVTAGNGQLQIYINGVEVGAKAINDFQLGGKLYVGSQPSGPSFQGTIDEIRISNVARSSSWVSTLVANQGIGGDIVSVLPAEQLGAGSSDGGFFTTLLKNTGGTGRFIIGCLLIMALISWLVMIAKSLYLRQVGKDNKSFLKAYRGIIDRDPTLLDEAPDDENDEEEVSPIVDALFGKHDHYQSSPIYQIYHKASREIQGRTQRKPSDPLTPQAANAIRATMDAQLVREAQKLNSHMILLTIAVSGGPFLGLLGTVVGVMITFAAIAETGDVNIAAIAPGVAAALLTTVAGLFVAIPALFGYNYLSVKVKENIANMRIFCDEFVTRVAEYYGSSKSA